MIKTPTDKGNLDGTDPSGIYEVTLLVTTLVEADNAADARHQVEEAGLDGLAYEIDEGAWLGQTRVLDATPLPHDRLEQRQRELGSDGSFFPSTGPARAFDPESETFRLQVAQGWSSETMSMLMHRFLRDMGLMGLFVERLREVAEIENAGAIDDEDFAP